MQTEVEPRVNQRELARMRVARVLFEALYRNRILYWLASTIPFAGQWRVWQRLALDRLVGEDVLEVGCGIGTLLADMIERGYRCQAIDQSPQMVAASRRELRRRGLRDDADIVRQASAQTLPFASASFDNAVSTFPTDYIADARALSEIRRILRPGGRLIVVLAAALAPTRAVLAPLIAIQRLVYGRQALAAQVNGGPEIGAPLLERMRLAGFSPRLERVTGPFWVAYVITATITTNLVDNSVDGMKEPRRAGG
ncbi:MAG TPA: class I SAM-dependent methyltransferase [Ktedonobacterales bacterium]|jgi:SAM-dependent methyltransferase|nr:class I SAM-dependent methyltransferase [Ktedonobacterales bacterium]